MNYPITTFDLPTTFTPSAIDEVLTRVKKEKFLKSVPTGVTMESIMGMQSYYDDAMKPEDCPTTLNSDDNANHAYASVYCYECGNSNIVSVADADAAKVAPCATCKSTGRKQTAPVFGFNIAALMCSVNDVENKIKNSKVLEALNEVSPSTEYSLAA